MELETFLETVEREAGVTQEQAHKAILATLQTLAERITGGEARDVAECLPKPLRHWMTDTAEPAVAFPFDEFVRRVAEREGVDEDVALTHARAVFVALGSAVTSKELRDMIAQLPIDFDPLLDAAGISRTRAQAP
jgi:uncharacterized protein (DUF2267 family)